LKPVQKDVDCDNPTKDEIAKATIESISEPGASGWQVFDGEGRLLRRFVDTNGDKKLDLWSYYQNGIEVYRDVDANFNEKADQYRWLGTSGSRWGQDPDEDGTINSWHMISPEEVTAEVVAALRDQDIARFKRVLLSTTELKSLGMGQRREDEIADRIDVAARDFGRFSRGRGLVKPTARWIHFGATRPGLLPAGTAGSSRDLLIYDNVAAIVDTDGKHGQVVIGTLVNVGTQAWRVIDLPTGESTGGFYTSIIGRTGSSSDVDRGIGRQMQELLAKLEKTDKLLSVATGPAELARLNGARADLLEKLAEDSAKQSEREIWIRQFADTVSAAYQSGAYPQGVQRMRSMLGNLKSGRDSEDLIAFLTFRYYTADYSRTLQAPNADFSKVQAKWLKDLRRFVSDFPRSPNAAEAMLQLAIAHEFSGKEDEATLWYGRIAKDFPNLPLSKKAIGASRRLSSVGKTISLKGTSASGSPFDLANYRGKVVLIHYWATWCEPCKADIKVIKRVQDKLGNRGFTAIGVNLDHTKAAMTEYQRTHRLTWPQLYEEGGMESRLASELGVVTLPTMLLIDRTGRVVRRNIHSGELEAEILRLQK
jgi:thiol-disulfide isomerase/thioredoxin